jgi:hypothetical protein
VQVIGTVGIFKGLCEAGLRTTEAIIKLRWTVLPHPSYSPDMAPSDYHLFGILKDSIRGTKFEDDNSLVASVKKWLKSADPEFYRAGIHTLVPR